MIASFLFSFTDWTGLSSIEWVGLANFENLLLHDDLFWIATRNTFFYSFGAVVLGTCGALFVAILLNQKLPGTTMLRVVYYMPSIASGVGHLHPLDLAFQSAGWSGQLSVGPGWH